MEIENVQLQKYQFSVENSYSLKRTLDIPNEEASISIRKRCIYSWPETKKAI